MVDTTVKTVVSGPQPIRCRTCPTIWEGTVDSARRHKWRVAWRPGDPNYCPTCWEAPQTRRVSPSTWQPIEDVQLPLELPDAA